MTHSIYTSLTSALGKIVLDDGNGEGLNDKAYIDLDLSVTPPDLGLRGFLGLSVSNLERSWAIQEEFPVY